MNQRHLSCASAAPLHARPEAHDRQNYYYPPIPGVQRPSAAHLNSDRRFSGGYRTEDARVQSSVSTASGSSDLSYQKTQNHIHSPSSQWRSHTLEETLVNGNSGPFVPTRSMQWHAHSGPRRNTFYKQSEMTQTSSPALAYIRERRQLEEEDDEEVEDDHAMWVLFWLSILGPFHSIASCLFTCFVTLGLLLATPVRLLHQQRSFGDQIIRTVAPLFKHHLEMMYAPSVDDAHEWDFRPGMLILVHIISPIISIGVAVASWVTGAFWVFTYIMGNPDGTERGDDGADAVLAVRNWWESCLLKALRPRTRESMRSVV
ncbi:hypothetical protein LTS08_007090 [Lithohypha guttulata]|nr:hypothetical protein LTS08_007090 [Lithohypha guttulata]